MQKTLLVAVALAFATACSNNSSTPTTPTTPAPLNLSGTWVGTVSFEDITGRMTWQLTQSGTNVTGPVILAMTTGTVLLNGFLTGTLNGSSLDYTISVASGGIPSQPTCAGQLKGTMAATATTLNGPVGLTSTNCTVRIQSNTVTLTKQ
jgi:hypothetical protein